MHYGGKITMKEQLMKLLGTSWYESMKVYLESEDFSKLGTKIALLRRTRIIYPESKYVFRAFQETSFDKVKVVLVGQDPYFNEGFADGLAFSNSLSTGIAPSLKNILIEVDDNYPEWVDKVDYGRLDRQDLSRWSKQGVLLLNVALTVEKGYPLSHIKYWEKFTIAVLEALNTKNEIIWVFFGKESQKYTKFVTNKTHTILNIIHPAAETYGRGAGFFGSNVFKEINEELLLRNKQIIQF
jgi:uracil-DNA glycosylase